MSPPDAPRRDCGAPLAWGRTGAGTLGVTMCSLDEPATVRPTLQNGIQGRLASRQKTKPEG
jgi:hypothetical protein